MNQFTTEDLKNILSLISIAPIKGSDALPVAMLQQKIAKMLEPAVPLQTVEEEKAE